MYTLTATVTDEMGRSITASRTVCVAAAPSASYGGPVTANDTDEAGAPPLAVFAAPAGAAAATIDWGNGAGPVAGVLNVFGGLAEVTGAYPYLSAGLYQAKVTLYNAAGLALAAVVSSVFVDDPHPPTLILARQGSTPNPTAGAAVIPDGVVGFNAQDVTFPNDSKRWIKIVGHSGYLRLDITGLDPTIAPASVRWKVLRNPDDAAKPGPGDLSDDNLLGFGLGGPQQVFFDSRTVGSFLVVAYVDRNGNKDFDDNRKEIIGRVKVIVVRCTVTDNPVDPNTGKPIPVTQKHETIGGKDFFQPTVDPKEDLDGNHDVGFTTHSGDKPPDGPKSGLPDGTGLQVKHLATGLGAFAA